MNSLIKKLSILAFACLITSTFTSCVKKEIDNPPNPAGVDPDLKANLTIAVLKAMDTLNGNPIKITDDFIISGVVIADDKSGNFYKEMVIQDSTGGISIQLDQSNYYTDFPVGRRVFIKLRGLYLGEYHGLIQLGGYYTTSGTYFNIERIPQALIGQHIIKGSYYHTVIPFELKITELDPYIHQNTLIRLSDVQFTDGPSGFANQPYSNGPNLADVNMVIQDCSCNEIELRNSDFADFGYKLTPSGNGILTGVYQIYDQYNQIKIRDLDDVSMNNGRCGAASGSVCLFNDIGGFMPLDSVRMLYQGVTTSGPAGRFVKGVVISDKCSGNIVSQNMVIQDSTGGITVRFINDANFPAGALVTVNIGGVEISEYNGLLQLNNVPNNFATYTDRCSIQPRITTINDIYVNLSKWESTLVTINDVTISGSGTTYNNATNFGTLTITDATGNTKLYTRSSASFASSPYPTTPVDLTGIVSDFNGLQINLRNTGDIK